ncbi:hypothetical protein CS022_17100 [Veronia nyctiphanis]|uniref:Uncharacterized protein n=1 Tax=Veronia nyctiphanis TaxID=1278244 RepID=A0A4Q0YMX7_9GAMM|nr:hypothetical protein [Veronia nyctiphanis]RXJ72262.1 hypothetical protein CS022_17100 [Veronia nyctiphanis]
MIDLGLPKRAFYEQEEEETNEKAERISSVLGQIKFIRKQRRIKAELVRAQAMAKKQRDDIQLKHAESVLELVKKENKEMLRSAMDNPRTHVTSVAVFEQDRKVFEILKDRIRSAQSAITAAETNIVESEAALDQANNTVKNLTKNIERLSLLQEHIGSGDSENG